MARCACANRSPRSRNSLGSVSYTHLSDADLLIDEFGKLSNAQRCEFVFAVATLDDPSSLRLLERALDDPCEAVALAAAHALTTAGRTAPLERFLSEHPGGRAESITASLELLA